ncbi:MAG: class I SAM-dependent methyltransferase [Candidatus Aminicenantes bacterium]|nr:MAG: class I SAM-dependent methyltransferase [Candidatus Aminicenantes bacterium]
MMNVQKYYEEYWDFDTDVSDNDVTTPERRRRLLETLARYLEPSDKVLDLGCGGEQFTTWLQESGYDAISMDISTNAVEMARHNNPGIPYKILNSGGSIPAEDTPYDAV